MSKRSICAVEHGVPRRSENATAAENRSASVEAIFCAFVSGKEACLAGDREQSCAPLEQHYAKITIGCQLTFYKRGLHGNRVYRARKNGHEHGDAAAARQPSRSGVRPNPCTRPAGGTTAGMHRGHIAGRFDGQADSPPGSLDHGALWKCDGRNRVERGGTSSIG